MNTLGMGGILLKIRNWVALYPAVTAWALNGGIALLAAYAFHLTKTQEAAVTTLVAAAATVCTAVMARPVGVPLILGALTTAITAAGAFGFHPPAQLLSLLVAFGSLAPAFGFHLSLNSKAYLHQVQRAEHAIKLARS